MRGVSVCEAPATGLHRDKPAVFGTPVDVTLSELAIELFVPADQAMAHAVRNAAR
jgi:hypothetical protein